jgi:hypothetical protein
VSIDHVSVHPQRRLLRISEERPPWYRSWRGEAMTDILPAFLALMSIGVFLAHALDAYRAR